MKKARFVIAEKLFCVFFLIYITFWEGIKSFGRVLGDMTDMADTYVYSKILYDAVLIGTISYFIAQKAKGLLFEIRAPSN